MIKHQLTFSVRVLVKHLLTVISCDAAGEVRQQVPAYKGGASWLVYKLLYSRAPTEQAAQQLNDEAHSTLKQQQQWPWLLVPKGLMTR